ncbi:MAG: ABC transporter permease [Lachnospiraceae bacterium]|nr:ABC transporter permease [Lachnospiraceae bacterium]MEE3461674.1 ABC transporter permease [Lachnospiraceae bacterium]
MIEENIRLAFENISANKLRSFLTMLGIIIGISSVITIITLGNSIKSETSKAMNDVANANDIACSMYAQTYEASQKYHLDQKFFKTLQAKYGDRITAISVTNSIPEPVKIRVNNHAASINLIGVTPAQFVMKKVELSAGRFPSGQDYTAGRPVMVITEKMADKLYGGPDKAIGQNIDIDTDTGYQMFTVVGVYYQTSNKKKSAVEISLTGEDTDQYDCYSDYKIIKSITHDEEINGFDVLAKEGEDADSFSKELEKFMKDYYKEAGEDVDIMVLAFSSVTGQINDVMGKITLIVALIAAISLLVGGIGVMNIMMVSITERTREIGTRKALGATDSQIKWQFISEAVILCLIGGIIGVLFGVLIGMLISKVANIRLAISTASILVSLGFSMAVGIFFGYYPAKKAAKMNPIDALRYE